MGKRLPRGPQPGDVVRVQFGARVIEGTVVRVRGDHMVISVEMDGLDDPIDRFVRTDALVNA